MIATLLELHGRNPSQTRSSLFLVRYSTGPASTSPRAFHGWTRNPPCFPSLAWWNKSGSGSFEVKPWSGPVLKKSFKWHALEKAHSLSVALEPLAIWNKKLEGLEFWLLKKLKISSEDMYPVAPEHLSGSFWSIRIWIEGLLSYSQEAFFLSVVSGSWAVNVLLRSLKCFGAVSEVL
jgi:hypothetical protein